MADLRDITLYEGHATPKDIILRPLPVAALVSTVIYLYDVPTPNDIILRSPTTLDGGVSFPTQFSGLRVYDGGVVELCLVAEADAPSGNVPKIRKGGTTYAVYLVDTSDGNASTVRLRTGAGTKAIRLKT